MTWPDTVAERSVCISQSDGRRDSLSSSINASVRAALQLPTPPPTTTTTTTTTMILTNDWKKTRAETILPMRE